MSIEKMLQKRAIQDKIQKILEAELDYYDITNTEIRKSPPFLNVVEIHDVYSLSLNPSSVPHIEKLKFAERWMKYNTPLYYNTIKIYDKFERNEPLIDKEIKHLKKMAKKFKL
jgi:methionine synthase II (cobalamin-independent)